jgi:hypothetical protein
MHMNLLFADDSLIELLSVLLKEFRQGPIDRGIRVCHRAPWITYLLFADDSLIFINAKVEGAARLNEILRIYNEASGQLVNREKSSIFLSPDGKELSTKSGGASLKAKPTTPC